MRWPFGRKAAAPHASTAVGNFQVGAQLPNGRNANFSMYVLEGESLDSINRKLDLCQDAIDRQRARCEIPELEAKREQMLVVMAQQRDVLADLEQRNRDEGNLSSQERMTLKNLRVTLGKMNDELKKGEEAIAEARRKAAA